MRQLRELTAAYARFMLGPRHGAGVCRTCFNLTDGYERCFACARGVPWLDAMAPISYSVGSEQLHQALASYKRLSGELARRRRSELTAVLWRFLNAHEGCIACAAGTSSFRIVTTVPSGDRDRDANHPLRTIIGELVGPTRGRHERLLRRSAVDVHPHEFNPEKYLPARSLKNEPVLLIDDMWTTGASAQSAAAALKAAGAGPTAAVVIGRHVNRSWHQNDLRLRRLARPFDWQRCALCAASLSTTAENGPHRADSSCSEC